MATPISNISHAQPLEATTSAKQPLPEATPQKSAKPPAPAPSAVPQDTVQISTAAQTALQEASETRVQTTQEASRGDRQAQKLLAKETPVKTTGK